MSQRKKIYFKNLDAIRFYAAMMVFLQHGFAHSFKFLPIQDTPFERILMLISSGGTGVSIFFVLSGFLITYLLIEEYKLNSKINIRHFYLRRFLRIWPLYYAVIIFGFILYPEFKNLLGVSNLLASNSIYYFAFLSNFDVINIQLNHVGSDAASQSITWSVAIEEQFYLFWPLIFLLQKNFWMPVIIGLAGFSIFFRWNHFEEYTILYFHTLAVIFDLCVGGILAYLISFNLRIRKFFMNTGTFFHILCFGLLFFVMYFGTSAIFNQYEIAFGRVVKTLLFGIIITAQSLTINKSVLNLGNNKFGTRWGKYTYGIYLIHPIVITIILAGLEYMDINRDDFLTSFSFGCLALILTFGISKLSYNYFEMPFLRLKTKYQTIKT